MDAVFGVLLESSVRALIIAIAVAGMLLALRVKSPKILHRAWTAVLLTMLLLPWLALWAPRISVPVLPPLPNVVQTITKQQHEVFRAPDVKAALGQPALSVSNGEPSGHRLGLYAIAMALYATGLCVLLARLLVGTALAFRLARGVSRTSSILHSAQCRIPLTVGLFHPHILLPLESENWAQVKLDAVLDHEKEHVRRRDPLIEWIAMLNRCIYWFHPLSWWICRKLAALAEQACDEAVLARGHEPASYAELLVDLARSAKRTGTLVTVGGSSINGSSLALRVRRILTARLSQELSRSRAALVTGLCTAAILVPSFVTLVRAQAPSHNPVAASTVQNTSAGAQMDSKTADAAIPPDTAAIRVSSGKSAVPSASMSQQIGTDRLQHNHLKEASIALENSLQTAAGKQDPKQAEGRQENFVIWFLTQANAQHAQMEIIAIIRMCQLDSSDSKPKNLESIRAAIEGFLTQFPNSEYAPMAGQRLGKINKEIDEKNLESLPGYYKKWLEEDVVYIISKEERSTFLSLATNDEREKFIEQFWARRNPDPNSPDNAAKTEHYRRLAYANQHFGCGIPGWKTDRGRIYILYGEPDGKESQPSGGKFQREFWVGGGETSFLPFELWRYAHLAGVGPAEFRFVNKTLDGCYSLEPTNPSSSQPLRASALILAEVVRMSEYFKDGSVTDVTSEVVPRKSTEYTREQSLSAYMKLFNAEIDPATNKANLQVSYTIMAGDRVILLIEDSEGGTYGVVGDGVVINKGIPLKDLQPGSYSLHVKVLDRLTNRSLETGAEFTVIR